MPTDGHEACEWYEVGQAAAWEETTKWLREMAGKAFIGARDSEAHLLRSLAVTAEAHGQQWRAKQQAKRKEHTDAD